MKQVWQTVDGKVFTDQLDAAKHEKEVMQGITMWDWDGKRSEAMIVRLVGENAAHNFKSINNHECYSIPVSDSEIGDGDEGIWFWDEFAERYTSIELKSIQAFAKILSEID